MKQVSTIIKGSIYEHFLHGRQQSLETGNIIIFDLQIRNVRLREVESTCPRPHTRKWHSGATPSSA